jgi:hypothetical protein
VLVERLAVRALEARVALWLPRLAGGDLPADDAVGQAAALPGLEAGLYPVMLAALCRPQDYAAKPTGESRLSRSG